MVNKIYIVDFQEAVRAFEKRMAHNELPTVDLDVVKWQVLAVFEQVNPMQKLEQLATELVKHDYLFGKEEFFESTPWDAREADAFLCTYLHEAIVSLGQMFYKKLREVGMFVTGTERYEITSRPLDNETYIFKRTRT